MCSDSGSEMPSEVDYSVPTDGRGTSTATFLLPPLSCFLDREDLSWYHLLSLFGIVGDLRTLSEALSNLVMPEKMAAPSLPKLAHTRVNYFRFFATQITQFHWPIP